MPITLAGVQRMGEPFPCHLTEYMRTIIYKIPKFVVREDHFPSVVIQDTPDFRAAVVTDLVTYLKDDDFSDQYDSDASFPSALHEKYGLDCKQSEKHVFIVIQFKEDLGRFPATDGQCIKIEHDGIEELAMVDCGDPYTPHPDERVSTVNAVLSAVRIEFEITDGLEKLFDAPSFRTDDGKWLSRVSVEMSANLSVLTPLALEDFSARSDASKVLVSRLVEGQGNGSWSGQRRRIPDFGTRLDEFTGALQMEPSTDDAYLRLWYLQAWDRLEGLGDAFRPRLQVLNDPSLEAEKKHRNDVAHRGVQRIDWKLLRSFQWEVFRIIKSYL